MKRLLSPSLNPAGLMAAAGAVYIAVTVTVNAVQHHGLIDPQVYVAAVGAVAALLTRQVVTPVADPRDGNGEALLRSGQQPSVALPAQVTAAQDEKIRQILATDSGREEPPQ